ncbi:unnamed protein product [Trifolium pratense]|uniref:Uncharacterized protein n=1 Tax=Trifolium pratense TaxID=57577 RepID=A0ACB0KKW5_TRIPR|nr:unnamed protein product [Trifolium pratense]
MVELHQLSGEDNFSGVSKVVLEYLAKSAKILSSANGLILCRDTTGNSEVQIFISNQATQTWLPIPIPEQLQGLIMSYNFENGTTRMSRVPKGDQRGYDDISCNMKIFKWGKKTSSTQSICLVRLMKNVFTI